MFLSEDFLNKKTNYQTKRIGILGGSFDPIHNGHLALGKYFAKLLNLSDLIFMLTPCPWQKINIRTLSSTTIRLHLLKLALQDFHLDSTHVTIGYDEINRSGPIYTVDTLKEYRKKLTPDTFLAFLIGADQYYSLPSWHQWEKLFDFTHICVASRKTQLPIEFPIKIRKKILDRHCLQLSSLLNSTHGKIYFATKWHYNVSSTSIRSLLKKITKIIPNKKYSDTYSQEIKNMLSREKRSAILQLEKLENKHPCLAWQYLIQSLPEKVLQYIAAHNLYQKNHE